MKNTIATLSGVALLVGATLSSGAGCSRRAPMICQPTQADQAGFSAGSQGQAQSLITTCGGRTYTNAYAAGYERGRAQLCDGTRIEAFGEKTGLAGAKAADLKFLAICDGLINVGEAFTVGNKRGIETFCQGGDQVTLAETQGGEGETLALELERYNVCSTKAIAAVKTKSKAAYDESFAGFCEGEGAIDAAKSAGESGQSLPSLSRNYRRCGKKKRRVVARAVKKTHARALKAYCRTDVSGLGYEDGETGNAAQETSESHRHCTRRQRKVAAKRYAKGYDRGVRAYCSDERFAAVAKASAYENDSSAPDSLRVCFDRFAGSRRVYKSEWADWREATVEQNCTRSSGSDDGESAATASNDSTPRMPSFCDRERFDRYEDGFEVGFAAGKKALCDRTTAYDEGLESGKDDGSSSYDAPHLCPGRYGSRMVAAYDEGYAEGAEQRGARIEREQRVAAAEARAERARAQAERAQAEQDAEEEAARGAQANAERERSEADAAEVARDASFEESNEEEAEEEEEEEETYEEPETVVTVDYEDYLHGRTSGKSFQTEIDYPLDIGDGDYVSLTLYLFSDNRFVVVAEQGRRASGGGWLWSNQKHYIQGEWSQSGNDLLLPGVGTASIGGRVNGIPSLRVKPTFNKYVIGKRMYLSFLNGTSQSRLRKQMAKAGETARF